MTVAFFCVKKNSVLKIIRTHIIRQTTKPLRLEDYIRINFTAYPSRKGIQKAIKRGLILLEHDKVAPGVWVKSGQRIDWLEEELNLKSVFPMRMEVIFEDDYLAIINKPSGIPVSGNRHRTVTNALSYFLESSNQSDRLIHPQPAHRLDAQTSGLLLVGKTTKALVLLNKLFEEKTIKKEYRAIVQGEMPQRGKLDSLVDGKSAITNYEVLKYSRSLNNGWVSVVQLMPTTGRTHQLRIHLAESGYPIVGDRLYGDQGNVLKGKGLFLCAIGLKFDHPITGEQMALRIDPPNKFHNYLEREQQRWKRYHEW